MGVISQKYFWYQKSQNSLNPKFFGCPTECAYQPFDLARRNFCGDCDVKLKKDRFREKVLTEWKKRLGAKSKNFCFDEILSILYTVIASAELSKEKLSVRMQTMLDVYLTEKNRYERVIAWQREQETKN